MDHQKLNPEHIGKLEAFTTKFVGLFKKHNIHLLGMWSVEGNESNLYLLSKFDSEEDVKTKVGLLQKDTEYQALSKEVREISQSYEEVRLVPLWIPE